MEDFDRDSNASSEPEQEPEPEPEDELMADAEDAEDDQPEDHDDDENDNENEDDDDDEQDNDNENEEEDDTTTQQEATQEAPKLTRTSATPAPFGTPKWQPRVRPEAITASTYDIVPTMAAPMATSVNALSVTPDLRYCITGGSDGYIRKYDGPGTINGKTPLTVAQRHPFVESVTKAGVLMSYWENAEPQSASTRAEDLVLSPVYSLAVHSQALWLLSGLESGGINLQSVRHDEGKRITCLQKHTNAVSVLTLSPDEKSVLSGSWDKNIFDWDLNTGAVKRTFDGRGGQVSAIEIRPMGGEPVPAEAAEEDLQSDTFFSNNQARPNGNFDFSLDGINGGINGTVNGAENGAESGIYGATNGFSGQDTMADAQGSPALDSIFGGSPAGSDLFGDNGFGGDDDNEFSRAIEQDTRDAPEQAPAPEQGDTTITLADFDMSVPAFDESATQPTQPDLSFSVRGGLTDGASTGMENGTTNESLNNGVTGSFDGSVPLPPQATDVPQLGATQSDMAHSPSAVFARESPSAVFAEPPAPQIDTTQTSDSTFLSASFDGTLRIWDRRVPNPIARIGNRSGVPPWCMGACWSPDGNWIYVGRRNGTVEEFSVAKARGARGGWQPERVFKFPNGSGPVSCVRPMPNGRHLICASHDILRLYDLKAEESTKKHNPPPFLIVPGPPRAGVISSLYIDPSSRFMLSASGTRGWEGTSTEVLIGYEIGVPAL